MPKPYGYDTSKKRSTKSGSGPSRPEPKMNTDTNSTGAADRGYYSQRKQPPTSSTHSTGDGSGHNSQRERRRG